MKDRRRRAVALRYDPGRDGAPVVVASGAGHRADQIRRLAEVHGVPIREDAALVEAMAALKEHTSIPSELYGAVAELLATLQRIHEAMNATTAADENDVA